MTARPPPELANELYCRANLEPMIYTGMNPQIATELLDRAWHMLSQGQISFSYNYIDKPKEGTGFFLKVHPDDVVMPHDGFQYMDDEVVYAYQPDPRVTITERSQGFAHGEQYTHIVRRKYTLTQPGRETLAFLHYSKADVSRSVVVDGRRAKTPARQYPLKSIPGIPMPMPGQPPAGYPGQQAPPQHMQQPPNPQQNFRPQQPPQQQPPKMGSPYGASPIMGGSPASPQQGQNLQPGYGRFPTGPIPGPGGGMPMPGGPSPQQGVAPPPQRLSSVQGYGNPRHEKKSSHKKHSQQHPQQQHSQQPQMTPQQQAQVMAQREAQMQEDAEEPSGDELDFLTARDVAIARYKRNHDYIAEVFSPYPTSRIIPPHVEYQKSIEFLKSLGKTTQQDDALDQLKTEHDEKIKKFKAEAAVFYKGLEDLKQATSVQDVFAANERVEVYKGMTVQPYLGLRQLELPKDESTKTPELKPAKIKQPAPVVPVLPAAAVSTDAPTIATTTTTNDVEMGSVIPGFDAPVPVTTGLSATTTTQQPQQPAQEIQTPVTPVAAIPVVEPVIDRAVEAALDNWSAPATVAAAVAVLDDSTSTSAPAPAPVPVQSPNSVVAAVMEASSSAAMEVDPVPTPEYAPVPVPQEQAQLLAAQPLQPQQEETTTPLIDSASFTPAPVTPTAAPATPLAAPVTPAPVTPVAPLTPAADVPMAADPVDVAEPVVLAAAPVVPVHFLAPVQPSTPASLPTSTATPMDIDSAASTVGSTPNPASIETPFVGQDADMTPAVAVAEEPITSVAPSPPVPEAIVTEETVVIPAPPAVVEVSAQSQEQPQEQLWQESSISEPAVVQEDVASTTTTTTMPTDTPEHPDTAETTPADTPVLPSS
ncbi:hypothetical protein BGZ83_007540 [Gryganskiella cystojenkinii]|nr:hypothetical protein BGZ83_007540 [Gryganskiella cystojenkinii]